MVSLIAVSSANFVVSKQPISSLNSYNCLNTVFVITPLKRDHPLHLKRKQLKPKKKNQFLSEFSGVVRMCKNWGDECDPSLELEVFEFMKNSENPQKFPAKKDLIEAGRMDLVDAIMEKGGWMRVGWKDEVIEEEDDELKSEIENFLEKNSQNGCESEEKSESKQIQERHLESSSFLGNSSPAASSSGRSLELATEEKSGIDGILSRLERQRNLNYGFKLGKNGTAMDFVDGEFDDKNQDLAIRKDVDSCHPQTSEPASLNHNRPMTGGNGLNNSHSNGFSSSLTTDTWRTWSVQRASSSDPAEFEAGEIDYGKNTKQETLYKSVGEIVAVTAKVRGAQDNVKDSDNSDGEIIQSDLKTRLQHLEGELSSVLHSIRSSNIDLPRKAGEQQSEDLSQLSDVSEFQENEMMSAQDKLRTLRAKLAVLEGKLSLAITDAQQILDEKQKRINDARRALQLLRTTCIVWPNPGSEVLLAGSFDGWATQRKMIRSSTGIFSLCLKLYPGKYEIKFIVDGVWRVDPLRPIVNNGGFENNLLTVT